MPDLDTLRYACQTYSWQMSLPTYSGRIEHMVATAAAAGFAGFEPELVMLGTAWSPASLRDVLHRHGVDLAALVLAEPWRDGVETAQERADADRVIEAVAGIEGAKIVLCPLPGPDRTGPDGSSVHDAELLRRQRDTMSCMTSVAERARDAGVQSTFHPNSPPGSLFRTAEDYQRMADLLPETIGYTGDLGHIAKGGMDPLTVLVQWRDRLDHLHVKDLGADGQWAETGEGVVDVVAVLDFLVRTDYSGWVTFEDESPQAERDPDTAAANNGRYVARLRSRASQVSR